MHSILKTIEKRIEKRSFSKTINNPTAIYSTGEQYILHKCNIFFMRAIHST